jgi:VanZ family protein
MLAHTRLWWTLGIALIALITLLSLLPLRGPPMHLPNGDKLNHLLAYVLLTTWFGQLLPASVRARAGLLLALVAYGASIEGLQSLTGYRSAEWADMAANITGMVLGLGLLRTRLGHTLRAIETRFLT